VAIVTDHHSLARLAQFLYQSLLNSVAKGRRLPPAS
jgi:hypothetical protein